MDTLTIKADIANLAKVMAFIEGALEDTDCNIKTSMQISIAVEELFVNVAHYAYAPGTGDVTISVKIHDDPGMAEITFKDRGIPYNPLVKDDPDVTLSAEKRRIGGLGIYMVKKSMDLMKYEYTDGCNIVTICKYF
jgi:anti-sigma regulatory factor (Ser/Thr protein kinase)